MAAGSRTGMARTAQAALIAAAAASPAAALTPDWVAYRTSPSGAVFSYDRASVRREGARVEVPVHTDYSKTQMPGNTVELIDIDCAAGTVTQKSFTRFGADGKPAEARPAADLMAASPIPPGTPFATLRRTLCQ